MTEVPHTADLMGCDYRTARKDHVCWTCGKPILKGTKYWKMGVKVEAGFFAVKSARCCEITPEIIDQNPQLHPALAFESIPAWQESQNGRSGISHPQGH